MKPFFWAAVSVATAIGAVSVATTPISQAATGPVLINEILASTSGDDREYIELFGTPGASLAGLSLIVVESDSDAPQGRIDSRLDLSGALGDNGFFLIANGLAEAEYSVTANAAIADNFLENSTTTVALVDTASLAGKGVGAFIDGAITVVDGVGYTDGGLGDVIAFGLPAVGPDGPFLPAGVGRIADGVDTDTAADWQLLNFNLGAPNSPTPGTTGDDEPVVVRKIHEVQGASETSPLVGQTVVVEGVVVGDEEGASPLIGGFFLQEEDVDVDGDAKTSEGIFVSTGGTDAVSIGKTVRVTGTVGESKGSRDFNGRTELRNPTIELLDTDGVATAAVVQFPLATLDALEAVESMLVTFPQDLVISEYFNYDRFGEIVVALPAPGEDRPMTPTAVFAPDSAEAQERASLNARSRITIDDGRSDQNPNEPVHPINRDLFSFENAFRGGDTASGLTGPLYVAFNSYRLLPLADGAGFDTYVQVPVPVAPDAVGGELTVATLNALNYFVTLDERVDDVRNKCGPDRTVDCRGADNGEEFERQRVKLLNTLQGMDADVIGLIEVENTTGVEPLADIVAGLNERLGAGTYDYVAAGEDSLVGGDAIKVGVIYRPAMVTPLGAPAILDTPEFLDPNDTGSPKNRAAVAQTFVENASGEVFSVTVNHLKSKASGCGVGDDAALAGSCDGTRTKASEALAAWVDTDPTGVDDDDWLILGDLNSYDKEAPIATLLAADFSDLIADYEGKLAYSYVFDGQFGYLDYVMSSASMTGQVTGATEWHVNSDTPDIFDYDTSFKSPYQASLFDPMSPLRSSDHDAALVGLSLDSGIDVTAAQNVVWPPNHKLRSISVVATDDSDTVFDVSVLDASSSEADSGLGVDDVANDIVITDGELQVRAERFSRDGRTYTAVVVASGGGQAVLTTVAVVVPSDQRGRTGSHRMLG